MAPELQEEEGTSGKWYIFNLVPQEILVMAPELQEDLLGTKDEMGSSGIHLYNSDLHFNRAEKGSFNFSHLYLYLVSSLVPQEMSWHQSCKRIGWVQLLAMSIKSISEFLNLYCKRCPSTSLYESKCV